MTARDAAVTGSPVGPSDNYSMRSQQSNNTSLILLLG